MDTLKRDMTRIQELVGGAFTRTGGLLALSDGGLMSPAALQRSLEMTMQDFEKATLELRQLCERHSPGVGGYGRRPTLPALEVTGRVERLAANWLRITINTLLPHCRYATPIWLTDTIVRLLDQYQVQGNPLPFFRQALLVIDEHCPLQSRRIFDQDNKGWKAVSNAIKGRLIPDDDQFTLGVALVSTPSEEHLCQITLLMPEEKKVAESYVCVVKDERLTPDTPIFQYPFSNVHFDWRICTGNNALPIYKDPARLHTLAAYLLRLPNNNDLFSRDDNKLHAEFRDLLEQMKGKEPSLYYTDVLVETPKTLKDFMNRR